MAKIVDPFAELWHPHRINSQIRCVEIELPMLKKEINYYILIGCGHVVCTRQSLDNS